MPKDKIWVERRRLETVVHVQSWPFPDLGLMVSSSSEKVAITTGDWKKNDRKAISRRLGSRIPGRLTGAEKGRVLYALEAHLFPTRWDPVAAMLFSLPARKNQPLVIYNVCLEQSLTEKQKRAATVMLVRCARNVAQAVGRARLRWVVNEHDAGPVCRDYGFERRGRDRGQAILELKV